MFRSILRKDRDWAHVWDGLRTNRFYRKFNRCSAKGRHAPGPKVDPYFPRLFFLATNFARRSSIVLLVIEGRVIARTSVQGENIRRGRRKEGRKEGRVEGRMEGRKEGKKERREAGDIPVFPIGLLCSLPCFQGVYII